MRWTEDKLRTKIPAKIREDRRAQGLDPDVRPTHEWLRDNGYSGIEGFARRNDMSVAEVLEEICGFDPHPHKPLGIDHVETRRLINEWLEYEDELFNQWGETRVADARTHFRLMTDIAYDKLGSTNLVRLVRADSSADVNLILKLFAGLASELETQGAQSNYTRSLERWAKYLVLKGEADEHKIDEVRDMMGYTYERESPEHSLEPSQIRACWRATETLEEQALFNSLTACGIRRVEPTELTVDRVRLDRDDPYVVFDSNRKTSAATVPVMAGVEVLEAWIDQLDEIDHWDGEWLFPSKKSRDGSRPPGWVNETVEEIVDRAGVRFPDGEKPTPKYFRSFWYEHRVRARQEWLTRLEMEAEAQGVSSAEIIDLHYLTDKPARDHFRKFAESYFEAAFGEAFVHGIEDVFSERDDNDDLVQKVLDDYIDNVMAELQDGADQDDDAVHESPATSDPASALIRERLHTEHAAAAASDTVKHYPPSLRRGMLIGAGLVCWAAIGGLFWGLTGTLYFNPLAGTLSITPESIIGLVLGVLLILFDLPDFDSVSSTVNQV